MSSDTIAPPPKDDSFNGQVRSLSGIFWISGWLEIIERFSYTAARVVLPLFMVAAIGLGGPELDHDEKAKILGIWAVVQSFVPILSGGFADRYGYKINVAISTFLKMVGYIIMASCIPLAEWFAGMPLAEARAQDADLLYEILFVAAITVALGTAIFKPGIGGLISSQLNEKNASLGWSVFYQLVNVGGFFGPLIAAYLRLIEWHWVFIICAAAIALNFIPLFFFKEPAPMDSRGEKTGVIRMFYQSICGLLEPRLFFYTLSFAGFWLMTFQIFDILPNFIDDWVDSRSLASSLTGVLGEKVVPMVNGGNLTQEWMINFNALLISVATFMVGYLTRQWLPLRTIIIGVMMAIIATYGLSMHMSGWWVLGCIIFFSLGEMLSGPANSYYIVSIAPPGKTGLYIGFSGFAVGIGQSIGSIIAGRLYQEGGDKVVLAKRYMEQNLGVSPEVISSLPKEDVLPRLQELTNRDAFGIRELLWDAYEPYSMWFVFALIGLGSLLFLCSYNHVIKASSKDPRHSFNLKGNLWVQCFLIPIAGAFIFFTWKHFSLALLLNTLFFTMMLVISFLPEHMRKLAISEKF